MIKPGTYNPYNTLTSLLRSIGVNTSWINNIGTLNSSTGVKSIGRTSSVSLMFKPSGHFTPKSTMERDAIRSEYTPDQSSTNFDVVSWAPAAVDFTKNAYLSFTYNRGTDDLLADAGYSNRQTNGVGYQYLNNVTGEMSNVRKENINNVFGTAASGAALGSVAGPWGAAIGAVGGALVGGIGSIFRSKKAEDAIEKANYLAANTNRVNLNAAMSLGMQMDFYKQYGNPEDLVLYADNGIDPRIQTNRKNMKLTLTKDGFMFAPHNAYGKGGEVIGNLEELRWDIIRGDKKDNKPLSMENGDTVVTDKRNLAKRAIPSVLAIKSINNAIDQLLFAIDSQKSENNKLIATNVAKAEINNLKQERNIHNENIRDVVYDQVALRNAGYLPQETQHASDGIDFKKMRNSNLIAGIAGIATGLGQFLLAHSSRIKRPYTYSPNTYGNRALEEASSLRVDTKPIIDAIDRESAAGRYRTMTAGGLSAAQRYLANVANIRNTQVAKSDALYKAGLQNNEYRSKYALMLATLGAQDATARMLTNQWDLDYYSKAHAARQQGEQMGIYNMLNSMLQYHANANKLGMYKGMYGLYASELTDEQRKILNQLS